MKKYVEAIEDGVGEDLDFIQEEVEADYSEAKKTTAKDKVKAKEKPGKTYKYRLHTCLHEENQPCTVEEL